MLKLSIPSAFQIPLRQPYGKVVAVGMIEGERYYWFVDKHGTVSMIPAVAVEKPEVEG